VLAALSPSIVVKEFFQVFFAGRKEGNVYSAGRPS
jgi:hypothetical protein